jgi:hypothetical protein
MSFPVIIFSLSLLICIPLSSMLLYVWWKYGNNEKGVAIARVIFLLGMVSLLGYMIIM